MAMLNLRHPGLTVVTRRVNVSTSAVRAVLAHPDVLGRAPLGDVGWLVIDAPLVRLDTGIETWHGRGRLYGRGPRLARYARVEIVLTAWSDEASELTLRPVCPYPLRWGARRLRRYFALAHLAGDHLARVLADAARATHPAQTAASTRPIAA